MALLAFVMPSALGSASAALPAAFYGLKVLGRQSSYLSLSLPRPAAKREQQARQGGGASGPGAFDWTLARELTRSAGGFEGRARWPLGAGVGCTLLDLTVAHGHAAPGLVRHHSVMTRSTPAPLQQAPAAAQHTSAAPRDEPAAPILLGDGAAAGAGALSVETRWFAKAQPRLKGISRKLVLRKINQKVVARLARRFTIGIPVLGFYFVSKLMVKDLARLRAEYAAGEYKVAALFATALLADVADLAAQATIIAGLGHNILGMGLAGAAALLMHADYTSLATAALSFSCGLGGELVSIKHAAAREAAELEAAGGEAAAAAERTTE